MILFICSNTVIVPYNMPRLFLSTPIQIIIIDDPAIPCSVTYTEFRRHL